MLTDQAEFQRIRQRLEGKISADDLSQIKIQTELYRQANQDIKQLKEEKAQLEQELLDFKLKLTPQSWKDYQARLALPDERTWWEKYQTVAYFSCEPD